MISKDWLDKDIFAVHLAHYIRRTSKVTDKYESVHRFVHDHKVRGFDISEDHVHNVLDFSDSPSDELLRCVNAEKQLVQKERYRFL